ncbi:MAG: hypothetical protein U9Q33_02705 [Campylobacterota bacterium]|nr:hypothetical protein [Campylobacterota bacterium]
MTIKNLNREQYLKSTSTIKHITSKEFSQQAYRYCNDYISWEDFPCLCLEENGKDVCYLFYHISKDKRYLTIDNILTPFEHRYKGYAKYLLTFLFNKFSRGSVIQRVKMFCVSSSLEFYMKLGIDFWGVNKLGQYYTEFPIPKNGIDEIRTLMKNETLKTLYNRELKAIYKKLELNGDSFDKKETLVFNRSLKLMGERYRFKELYNLIHL